MTEDITLEKGPPRNIDAERSVLGAILVDNDALNEAVELIHDEDFYLESHRLLYRRMGQLSEQGAAIDLVTLKEELKRRDELERVGGAAYLASLIDGIPRSINTRHYAQIVKEKSILRRLIHSSNTIINACFREDEAIEHILSAAERRIFEIAENRLQTGFLELREIVARNIETIDEMSEKGSPITGLPTGYVDFDQMTSGLQRADLIVIAARPSMGKTSLALNIAQYVATRLDKVVGIFSLEMSKEQLGLRMLSAEARINFKELQSGFRLSDEDWDRLGAAFNRLSEAKIFIDDSPGPTPLEIRAKARRLKAEHGLDLLIVDYLQLMETRQRYQSRTHEITELSRSLKAIAKELDVPVIALSQLSRAPEKRTNHRPQLADLRESGAIEQDADLVSFIYREELYRVSEENRGRAEIIIGKQRNGPIGMIQMVFLDKYTKFENLAKEQDAF